MELSCRLDRDRFDPVLLVTRHGGPLEEVAAAAGVPVKILGREHRFDARGARAALATVRAGDVVHAHKFAGAHPGGGAIAAHGHAAHRARAHLRRQADAGADARVPVLDRTARRADRVRRRVRRDLAARGGRAGRPRDSHPEWRAGRRHARACGGPRAAGTRTVRNRRRDDRVGSGRRSATLSLSRRSRCCERAAPRWCSASSGDGPLRDDLAAQAHELGVDQAVVWAGEVPNAGRLARAFDLTCSAPPSRGCRWP